jgi:hypothetical protein
MFSILYLLEDETYKDILDKTVGTNAKEYNIPLIYVRRREDVAHVIQSIQTPFTFFAPHTTYIHVQNVVQTLLKDTSNIQVIGAHPNVTDGMNIIDFDCGYVFKTILGHEFSYKSNETFEKDFVMHICKNNVTVRVQGGLNKMNYECSYRKTHVCDTCLLNFKQNNIVFTFGNMSPSEMETYYLIQTKGYVQIAVAFMIKDEELKVKSTLDVYANHKNFPEIYILDTGSTDKTIEKVEEWMREHPNTHVEIYHKEFVDFSFNRNYILDIIYKQSKCEYILSIDCNDELKNEELLMKYLYVYVRYPTFFMNQSWKAGSADPISFNTIRLIKNNKKYHWKYRVHEVLVNETDDDNPFRVILPDEIKLFQFREEEYEREKSARFKRDLTFFLEDYEKYPKDTRIVFYLAQTYFFNNDYENCIIYSKKRIELAHPTIRDEETYQSIFRIAKCHILLKHEEKHIKKWLWRAWDYMKDIEPLLYLAQLYEKDDVNTALHLYLLACETEKPMLMLPIRHDLYSFERYNKTAEMYYKKGNYTKAYEYYSKILTQKCGEEYIKRVDLFTSNFYPSHKTPSKPVLAIYGGFFYDRFWNGKMYFENKITLGGSESMVIRLAHLFAKEYQVFVFCNTEEATTYNGVTYLKLEHYNDFMNINKVKHLVLSRDGEKTHKNAENIHLWLHDLTHISTISDSYKTIIVLSEFHKQYYSNILQQLGKTNLIPLIKIVPNMVQIQSVLDKSKPYEMRFIYSSCPTRGLEKVLSEFERIRKEYPVAELYIYSDFNNDYVKKRMNVETVLEKIRNMEGVHNIGRLPESEFLKECKKANYWYYPTEWLETFCITAVQMINNAVIPIYNPVGSLPDVLEQAGVRCTKDGDILQILQMLKGNKKVRNALLEKGFEQSKKFGIEPVKKLWNKILE